MPNFTREPIAHLDLIGQPLPHRSSFWWNEQNGDGGDVTHEAFARFFARLNRRGVVVAPHFAGNMGPSLSRFRYGADDAYAARPIHSGSPYGICFFCVPTPDGEHIRDFNLGAPDIFVNGIGGDEYQGRVLFQGKRHVAAAGTGPYGTITDINAYGVEFAHRVRETYEDANTEYLGHVPLLAIGDMHGNEEVLERIYDNNADEIPPLAWVFNNFTVIPYDFVHYSESRYFVHWLLERVADIVLGASATAAEPEPEPVPLTPEEQAEAERLRIDNTVSSLTEWAASRDDRAVAVAMQAMDQVNDQIHRKLQELTLLRLQARERMVTVETMRSMATTPSELALISFKRMLESGLITSAMAVPRSTRLVFDTRELVAQDERTGAYHLIGKMRIDIDMGSGAVKFSNLDRRINALNTGMQAPHIYADGRPCLGSFADTIPEFVARADWVGFIEAAIQFVESANTRDPAGKYVCRWPFIYDPTGYGLPPYEGVVEPYVLH